MDEHTDLVGTAVNSKQKSDFGILCRELRVSKGHKQREVAAAMGVKLSTYGNLECSHWKVVSREKAVRLISFYGLLPDRAAVLLAAWERCPLSPHGEKRRAGFEKVRLFRGKARNHDSLQLGFIDLLAARLMDIADEFLCQCEFGEPACLTCGSLERLGLPPYTGADRDQIFDQLEKLREKLVAPPAERP
jgi:transcriptional regulator with XRE-family HTH domain